ncbi:hypothetical protein SLEP1_g1858 [Rubroshorea leprosula]|uniref:Uncharacterized protein n=1 Tax=Rubroshorea leprosula TaxID=152421 RepID=A0AAV5HNX6_9ROSI|nr:hypothetical protein SLEP1_g1858 [Rubroshorea leprosula]
MHVGGITVDPNWFLQLIITLFVVAFGVLYLVKNTASKYFEVDANFDRDQTMTAIPMDSDRPSCAACGNHGTKVCSRCKSVRYCSPECQRTHWKSGHRTECKENSSETARTKKLSGIALVPASGTSKIIKKPRKVLFPYDEFLKLFNWEKPGFPPCGLLNCGNSCFVNVVLQCLVSTRPLVAYLLEKGHQGECGRDDWCFLCEFQTHVERASQSPQPFSPTNIFSCLKNIGGNLGYGRQEDAHEFMRFAIDRMQSVCLDEFGGEKAVDPSCQETTLIQHIFGGHLQSQVICTKCNKISNQYENMMDLTVEIHGDATSLEECLDQFTVKEWLHGENMYKCDGCNDYVKAWKRLTVRRAPNILTIALKRFQSGRFGKLNKRVSFPETLDLTQYMSEEGDGTDVYRLYAVVVHVDMLNASFFGHYICYTKDFQGSWYRIDDCKVVSVELEEVLSEGAYMLLYSRVSARPSCLRPTESGDDEQKEIKSEVEPSPKEVECSSAAGSVNLSSGTASKLCNGTSHSEVPRSEIKSSNGKSSSSLYNGETFRDNDSYLHGFEAIRQDAQDINIININGAREGSDDMSTVRAQSCSSNINVDFSCSDNELSVAKAGTDDPEDIDMVDVEPCLSALNKIDSCEEDLHVAINKDSEEMEI